MGFEDQTGRGPPYTTSNGPFRGPFPAGWGSSSADAGQLSLVGGRRGLSSGNRCEHGLPVTQGAGDGEHDEPDSREQERDADDDAEVRDALAEYA